MLSYIQRSKQWLENRLCSQIPPPLATVPAEAGCCKQCPSVEPGSCAVLMTAKLLPRHRHCYLMGMLYKGVTSTLQVPMRRWCQHMPLSEIQPRTSCAAAGACWNLVKGGRHQAAHLLSIVGLVGRDSWQGPLGDRPFSGHHVGCVRLRLGGPALHRLSPLLPAAQPCHLTRCLLK